MNKRVRANLLLLLTAFIWGLAFVAQDVAMDTMGPFTFNAVRLLIAAIALLPCIALLDSLDRKRGVQPKTFRGMTADEKRTLLIGGICCGLALGVASGLQQLGIKETSAGKAGFVTALYIVLVPLAGLIFGKRVHWNVWVAVGLCTVGLFLLCVSEALTIGLGDVYLLGCALCFTVHILTVDRFSPRTDCVRMSCLQFLVAALVCGVMIPITGEIVDGRALLNGWLPILYAGVLSGAAGYTLQMIGQRDTDPTVASLLMSLESLFAVLGGWFILGDVLSSRELIGCAVMMCGIVLAQLPSRAGAKGR